MHELFDFSGLEVGQELTRIQYNLWINGAKVTSLTKEEIHCFITGVGPMVFDRRTGVCTNGARFGIVINRSGQGAEHIKALQRQLAACVEAPDDLQPETISALRQQLAHDW